MLEWQKRDMEFYHVLNRGVEKRNVFLNDGDRIRFIHDLYVFNDARRVPNYIVKERVRDRCRDMLVHIHAFCLMPNHYHLMVSPVAENGISAFMQKINMGYSKYFNEKYERKGVLWQGKHKKIPVARDAHFLFLPYYIHLNPLDLIYPEWREGKVKNIEKALSYLEKYRWSSHLDYTGVHNFPSLIQRSVLADILGSRKKYEREICQMITMPSAARDTSDMEMN